MLSHGLCSTRLLTSLCVTIFCAPAARSFESVEGFCAPAGAQKPSTLSRNRLACEPGQGKMQLLRSPTYPKVQFAIRLKYTCNIYRNSEILTDMSKTVKHISKGRLILGIGAGWFERDYSEYGYEFGTGGERLADLERSLEIIRHRWEVDVPSPVRNPIPILIGAGGEKKTLRIAARYANRTHTFGDPGTFARKMRVLDNWCAEIGRKPLEIERSCGTQKFATDAQRDAYVKARATHLILGLGEPWDFDAVKDLVRWRDKNRP